SLRTVRSSPGMVSTTAVAASAMIASTIINSTSVKPRSLGRRSAFSVNVGIVVGSARRAVGAERPDVERLSVRPRRLIIIGAPPRIGGQLLDIAAAAIAFGLRERRRRGDERAEAVGRCRIGQIVEPILLQRALKLRDVGLCLCDNSPILGAQ